MAASQPLEFLRLQVAFDAFSNDTATSSLGVSIVEAVWGSARSQVQEFAYYATVLLTQLAIVVGVAWIVGEAAAGGAATAPGSRKDG